MGGRRWGGRIAMLGAAAAALIVLPAGASAEMRAVIELFTSQGCSSCPAADKLIGEFSKDPTLLPLSLAIDYWDYLGWKDTLALPGHGNRQRAYARVRGDRDVFTPQAVVNGLVEALGNDRSAVDQAILKSRAVPSVLSVPVRLIVDKDMLTVNAAGGQPGLERAEVWLCPVSKTVTVHITRGENKDNTLSYHNVVRRWIKIGEWQGAPATWHVPVKDFKSDGVDEVAVLLQAGAATAPGAMYGAAMSAVP